MTEDKKIDPKKFLKLRHLLIDFLEMNNITTSMAVPLMIDLIFTIFDENVATVEQVEEYFDEVKEMYRRMLKRKEPPELHGGPKNKST